MATNGAKRHDPTVELSVATANRTQGRDQFAPLQRTENTMIEYKPKIGELVYASGFPYRVYQHCHRHLEEMGLRDDYPFFVEDLREFPIAAYWVNYSCSNARTFKAIFVGYRRKYDGIYLPSGVKMSGYGAVGPTLIRTGVQEFFEVRKTERSPILLMGHVQPIE